MSGKAGMEATATGHALALAEADGDTFLTGNKRRSIAIRRR